MKTDVVSLSALLMLIYVLFFRSLSALRSAGDRLFFAFAMFTSACSNLTLSRDRGTKRLVSVNSCSVEGNSAGIFVS